ncbi:hypothetical protein HAX54_026536 [Datura stramonium]|uniref:Uncharacterized protein n=1 Tax=Datura stramonium TaxID=4076 RepID=A0ABS8S7Y0_DATST|nr:hypothetical protein [Datura stramonium]
MAAEKLRMQQKIKKLLGDYDAMHARRGDEDWRQTWIKSRCHKTMYKGDSERVGWIEKWAGENPITFREGRVWLLVKEIVPGSPLVIGVGLKSTRIQTGSAVSPDLHEAAYSSNYSSILDPLIDNNYELFMVERLILMGAKTFIKTMKEDDADLSLSDDPKKNTKKWEIPVYTRDNEEC